jgi:hypothetical protein
MAGKAKAFGLGLLSSTTLGGGLPPAIPTILVSTDWYGDIDDVGAAHVWNVLADRGETTIAGVVMDSSNESSPAGVQILNSRFSRPSIPIGSNKDASMVGAGTIGNHNNWPDVLRSEFGNRYNVSGYTRANYPDGVTVMRQVFAAAAAGSIRLVLLGFQSVFRDFLYSAGDGISALTGEQLYAAKTHSIHAVWGRLPSGAGYNAGTNATNRQRTADILAKINLYPAIPIYLVDEILGESYLAAPASGADPAVNPAKRVYNLTGNSGGRYVYDMLSVLSAVRGVAGGGFALNPSYTTGTLTMNVGADTLTWTDGGAHGNTSYLQSNATNFATVLNTLLATEPVNPAADLDPPAMTSSATATGVTSTAGSMSLAADETSTFAITGGANAASFSITGGSTLNWVALANGSYVVQVTPTDTAGNVGPAQTITLTVAAAGANWDVDDLTTLPVAWLDVTDTAGHTALGSPADGAAVTGGSSLFGSITFTQSDATRRPIYRASGRNSKPSLEFDGGGDQLAFVGSTGLPTGNPAAATLVGAGYSEATGWRTIIGFGAGSGSLDSRILLQSDGNKTEFNFYGANPTPLPTDTWYLNDRLVIVWWNGASYSMTVDGGVPTTHSQPGGTIGSVAGSPAGAIGAAPGRPSADWFDGHIQIAGVIPGVISESDRFKLEGRLMRKLGRLGALRSDHPYKSIEPTV